MKNVTKDVVCKFKFECLNSWDELQETEKKGIKYCTECESNVYSANNINEFYGFAEMRRCVAIEIVQENTKGSEPKVKTLMGDPILKVDYETLMDE